MNQQQNLMKYKVAIEKHNAQFVIEKLKDSKMGEYTIEGTLARGAFGQVYEGYHTQHKHKIVIKFTRKHEMNNHEYNVMKKVNQLESKKRRFRGATSHWQGTDF